MAARLRVVIGGGGTGGHVYPGIAVAREFVRQRPEAMVTFVGTVRGLEARAVPDAGFEVEHIRSAGLKGRSWGATARSAAHVDDGVHLGHALPMKYAAQERFAAGACFRGVDAELVEQRPALCNAWNVGRLLPCKAPDHSLRHGVAFRRELLRQRLQLYCFRLQKPDGDRSEERFIHRQALGEGSRLQGHGALLDEPQAAPCTGRGDMWAAGNPFPPQRNGRPEGLPMLRPNSIVVAAHKAARDVVAR